MKVKVMYQTRSGNTKKVADVIAEVFNQKSEKVPPAYPLENVDLLFLGAGIYKGDIDKSMKEFIRTLDSKRAKNIAIFGTSGGQDKAVKIMKELLQGKGINVLEESFICKGRFFFFLSRSHPDQKDLQDARDFAKKVAEKLGK
ncbi:MAG: nitric oxide synthase [Clostridia bacterium]|nr:nitric oxide synthase [Clostridia bacterium]